MKAITTRKTIKPAGWTYYLKNNALPERYRAKGLDKVAVQLKIDIMTTQEKIDYQKYMENLLISKSMLETAKFEGEHKGKIEGKIEERSVANYEFTTSLIINTDFSDEKIALIVGVEPNWVAEIRKEMEK